jgi:hypothetical protein
MLRIIFSGGIPNQSTKSSIQFALDWSTKKNHLFSFIFFLFPALRDSWWDFILSFFKLQQ